MHIINTYIITKTTAKYYRETMVSFALLLLLFNLEQKWISFVIYIVAIISDIANNMMM